MTNVKRILGVVAAAAAVDAQSSNNYREIPSLTEDYHYDVPHNVSHLSKDELQQTLIHSLEEHKLQIMLFGYVASFLS